MKQIVFNGKITKKNVILIVLSVVLLVIYFLFLNLIKYRCMFHEFLDIWCPGCGGTRMIISFVKLDFYQAFRWNPLLFILLICGIIYLIIGIIMFIRKRVILVPTMKLIVFIIILLILYMIIRNIDMFSYLIPTKVS